jgi:hypothetical protein
VALVIGCSPVAAQPRLYYEPGLNYEQGLNYQPRPKYQPRLKYKLTHKDTARNTKEPFGDIPQGPLQIFISIDQQKLYLYSDGNLVAKTSVATGVPSLPTPLGVFSVIQKQIFHRSNIYSNAPMPFMQRITWSGVAMHEGEGIGHRASHGCIRMPHDFAVRLYHLTRLGARVIIARNELTPVDFADSHLFVHRDMTPAPAEAAAPTVQTARSVDRSNATDASGATDESGAATPSNPTQSAASQVSAANSVAAAPITAATPAPAAESAPQADSAAANTQAIATNQLHGGIVTMPSAIDTDAQDPTPLPLPKPNALVAAAAATHAPISIFVSRKTQRIYVRQNFAPLFDAPISIEDPDRPLGTHVFTAMDYLSDGMTFRWNVVSFPAETQRAVRIRDKGRMLERYGRFRHREPIIEQPMPDAQPLQTPEQALARIDVPQDVMDQISQLMVPGSSLVVSDQGLGPETGEGTDFIVITH